MLRPVVARVRSLLSDRYASSSSSIRYSRLACRISSPRHEYGFLATTTQTVERASPGHEAAETRPTAVPDAEGELSAPAILRSSADREHPRRHRVTWRRHAGYAPPSPLSRRAEALTRGDLWVAPSPTRLHPTWHRAPHDIHIADSRARGDVTRGEPVMKRRQRLTVHDGASGEFWETIMRGPAARAHEEQRRPTP
jgi:hypothetical protein